MNLLQDLRAYADLKILYVESNLSVKDEISALLKKLSPHVVVTNTAQDTLTLYKNHYSKHTKYFDIVIISLELADAIILVKDIKKCHESQVIALITQNQNAHYFPEVINLGIDKYISEPLTNINDTQLALLELAKKSVLMEELENKAFLLEQKNKLIDENIFLTVADIEGNIKNISQAYLDFTGYTKAEILGKNHSIFRNHDVHRDIIKDLWQTISTDNVWEGDLKNRKSSGEEYWIHTVISPLYDKTNKTIGFTSISKDITYQKRLEYFSTLDPLTSLYNKQYFHNYLKVEYKRAIWREESFALLLIAINNETLNDDLIIQVADFLQERRNPQHSELFRVSQNEFALAIRNKNDNYVSNVSDEIIKFKAIKNLQLSIGGINLDTSKFYLNCDDLYSIADENLHKAQKNTVVLDVNEYAIKNLKSLDRFTKLPNHTALNEDLSLLKKEAMLVILHVNQLNVLKELYGNAIIQDIIRKKAKELHDIVHDEQVTLYNLNLQEFAFLITNKNLFDKYLLLVQHSLLLPSESEDNPDDESIVADFTAGVAYGVNNILSHANIALQEALISQKKFRIYKNKQSLKDEKAQKLQRLKVYKTALYNGDIIPYFQPIIDTQSGDIVKYEALARIQTDSGEIISPYYFLDVAKEDKTFEYFTRQMMQKVFNIYAKNNTNISINLSYENLNSPSMLDYIKNRLDKYGGEGITFEILESEDIDDYSIVETFILLVKQYGCKVAIDDFGSGYSNFTTILRLHIDYIKLDGSLITQLNKDENINNMVRGIIQYAKQANIRTIAEFVSNEELADLVKEFGVDLIQGYYYGEPQDPKYYGLI
ncbi:EAL domain-containing protein [Sulfurimonas autotrophica]|uniref:Response regulator receiver modulated diguanylate cyclase/phosphodiesterase with PAS/PAC sensor(S) n=1 Tax=Sulfurimonas autotrophica (strain ATCC BAA-671 / DSM 16294 / JCM 11897 / OK10) TaxID=563040 RepID=E0UQV9_SULAO|nr:EAL domain-containing protein [Sulfurimonas autotrophica]ADN08840.1 response regulator receiver modulated diguanylate cyclase/phosphodiesterase with PAS/PAC sensor(s) [Sulfurimonas autotrophica DSM 16294]